MKSAGKQPTASDLLHSSVMNGDSSAFTNAGGVGKNRDHVVSNSLTAKCNIHRCTRLSCRKLVTLVAGKQRRLLLTGDGQRSVYDKKPQRYAKTTEQNLTLCRGNLKPK